MADIELVIKIPEQSYQLLKNEGVDWLGAEHILNAVANGTPLPKGHGKLKDFDEIEWYGCFEGRGCEEVKGDCSVCSSANCYANQVRGLPTIIEADKESDEEKC